MKYILVTGGVISGIGKGVVASSIGKILKSNGYEVTAIKIDPYINIDAGTFSPYEHGEVYVLDDGGEVDLDLGNYERFMDIKLHSDNNITTGKIYQDVINRERKGEFLGKTVQVVPHITDAIQEWVERVALKPVSNCGDPEICIIELGGTIGDIEGMPFVEAFRQFQFRVKKENFCCVHVSLVPQPKSTGEHKTKPTQASVRELRGLGLSPDLIVCRSENPIDKVVKEKISNFCHVAPDQVICLHDVKSVYHVPMFMEQQKLVEFFHERLQLPLRIQNLSEKGRNLSRKWRKLVQRMDHHINEVKIALVGKYTGLEDSYASVIKALQHATIECSLKLNLKFIAAADLETNTLESDAVRYHEAWQELCKADGVLVPGGFGSNGVEGKIAAIGWARKNKIPFLGICLGFQLAVVEFARNVLGWDDAHTYEISQDKNRKNVVIEMPEHHTGVMGGTMRLGKKLTMFRTQDSILRTLYKKEAIEERHRHRYEVDKVYAPEIEKAGLKFVAEDETGERLEILELQDHPYFVAVQFHPEYLSRPLTPSPPYLGLILASCNKLKYVLEKGVLPTHDFSVFSDEETESELVSVPNERKNLESEGCASLEFNFTRKYSIKKNPLEVNIILFNSDNEAIVEFVEKKGICYRQGLYVRYTFLYVMKINMVENKIKKESNQESRVDFDKFSYKWDYEFHTSSFVLLRTAVNNSYEFPFEIDIRNFEDDILIDIKRTEENFNLNVRVKCQVLLTKNLDQILSRCDFFSFDNKLNNVWHFPSFIKKSYLEGNNSSNTWTLKVYLFVSNDMFSQNTIEEASKILMKPSDIQIIDSLRYNFQIMLISKKFTDMKLLVNKEIMNVHKNVLPARSPVFAAMFDQDMTESQTGTITISDIDSDTMKLFLKFLYSGKLDEVNREKMLQLLLVAEKYQVLSLKEKCCGILTSSLNTDNICDVVSVADMVGHKILKTAAINYIKENSAEILSSPQWLEWVVRNVRLGSEILLHFLDIIKKAIRKD